MHPNCIQTLYTHHFKLYGTLRRLTMKPDSKCLFYFGKITEFYGIIIHISNERNEQFLIVQLSLCSERCNGSTS